MVDENRGKSMARSFTASDEGAKAMDEIDRRDRLGNVRTVKLYRDYYRGLPENGTGQLKRWTKK